MKFKTDDRNTYIKEGATNLGRIEEFKKSEDKAYFLFWALDDIGKVDLHRKPEDIKRSGLFIFQTEIGSIHGLISKRSLIIAPECLANEDGKGPYFEWILHNEYKSHGYMWGKITKE